ncbi:hypothetical protein AX767_06620 [Variovorax sp. PAMC 28711]|nr:hypothetical protein AX767_06620 [Variovorax sp. PAMC 28711]
MNRQLLNNTIDVALGCFLSNVFRIAFVIDEEVSGFDAVDAKINGIPPRSKNVILQILEELVADWHVPVAGLNSWFVFSAVLSRLRVADRRHVRGWKQL